MKPCQFREAPNSLHRPRKKRDGNPIALLRSSLGLSLRQFGVLLAVDFTLAHRAERGEIASPAVVLDGIRGAMNDGRIADADFAAFLGEWIAWAAMDWADCIAALQSSRRDAPRQSELGG